MAEKSFQIARTFTHKVYAVYDDVTLRLLRIEAPNAKTKTKFQYDYDEDEKPTITKQFDSNFQESISKSHFITLEKDPNDTDPKTKDIEYPILPAEFKYKLMFLNTPELRVAE